MAAYDTIVWSFGLKNSAGFYLTAETFGFSLNALSKVMKKKQIFVLEQVENTAFLKTPHGRYLTFKETGKVLGDAEKPGADESLTIEPQQDGRWALRTQRGYYFGGAGENLDAYTKEIKPDRLWIVQLAMHPQICLKSLGRKRYVHISGNQLTTDEDIPWGSDPLITLVFFEEGKYALQTDDGRYYSESTELKARVDASCKLTLDFFQDLVAFRTASNKYLAPVGANGLLKANREWSAGVRPSRDELFSMEDSQPQFTLRAKSNQLYVSASRGVEVHAFVKAPADPEFFQFEINPATKLWSIRTSFNKFWGVAQDNTIQATTEPTKLTPANFFEISWLGPNLTIKASNGNLVNVRKNGQLAAETPAGRAADDSTFVFVLINRPRLVLRSDFGFVRTNAAGLLESNAIIPEVFTMDVTDGICKFSNASGQFWKVGVNGINVTAGSGDADPFTLEFTELSKFVIRTPNGSLLQSQQVGSFTATGSVSDASTLLEY